MDVRKTYARWSMAGLMCITACVTQSSVFGQSGVAPSQTGLFFDDLRHRANQTRMPVGTGIDGSTMAGSYDYNEGEYTSDDARDLGERYYEDEEGRTLGYPPSGSNTVSARKAGDFAANTGPYAAGNTYFAPSYLADPFLAGKRNVKLGPVNIGLAMNGSVEYNDNINRSRHNKIDDVILGTFLSIDSNYVLSENNRLSLTMGVGLDYYLNHPEYSPSGNDLTLNVLPGSTLAFDVKVGDVQLVFYDRLSVRPVSNDEFTLDDYDFFGSVQNDIGVAANWAINSKLNLSLNFTRSDSWAIEDSYSQFDRVVNSVSGSLAWSPSGTYIIGVESAFSWIDYDENFNNDGTTASSGLFVIMPLSKATVLKASVGWQHMEFDSPPMFVRKVTGDDLLITQNMITGVDSQITQLAEQNSTVVMEPLEYARQLESLEAQREELADLLVAQTMQKQRDDNDEVARTYDSSSKLDDYYYNFTLFSKLNSRVSHQLSAGHESSLNNTSNYITADYVNYGLSLIAWRGSRITLSGFYEQAEESGGRLAEDTDQWGYDVFYTQRLTSRVVAGLGYHYGNTDSNLVGRDYEQHSITADLNFSLNSKLNVGLGYRFWTTDSEDDNLSFDQNRVMMTVNYNF